MGLFMIGVLGFSILFYGKFKIPALFSILIGVAGGIILNIFLIFAILLGLYPTLILGIIVIILGVILFKNYKKSWANGYDKELSPIEFSSKLSKRVIDKKAYIGEDIPYNRAIYFSEGSELNYSDDVFPIIFNAEPHDKEMIFQEYGYLVTTNELIIKLRIKNDNNEEHKVKSYHIPFSKLLKSFRINNTFILIYLDSKPLQITVPKSMTRVFEDIFSTVIDNGWNRQVEEVLSNKAVTNDEVNKTEEQIESINESYEKYRKQLDASKINQDATKSSIGTNVFGLNNEINSNQSNARFHHNIHSQGHGVAAEQMGNVKDRFLGRNAVPEGASNAKHGADRIVNGMNVQTKFYKTARGSIDSCFQNGNAKYINNDGSMMIIEVPKDQYAKSIELIEMRIKKGQIPNETNVKNASKYVKKNPYTYEQAQIATKSIFDRNSVITNKKTGETRQVTFREKLVYSAGGDFMTGASIALPTSTVMGIWVYCNCKWNGMSTEEALKQSSLAAIKPVLFSGFTYMFASQFSSSRIGQHVGKTIASKLVLNQTSRQTTKMMTNGTMVIVTVAFTVGPDVIKCVSGRISSQQLIKNTATAGVGVVGGALTGAMLGVYVPVIGTAVGGVVGGIVASVGAKKVLDNIIEDDAVLMLKIAKQEFIEVVMLSGVNTKEFQFILDNTFLHKNFNKVLQLMYASGNPRSYIHEIYYALVQKMYEERPLPDEEELIKVFNIQNYLNLEKVS